MEATISCRISGTETAGKNINGQTGRSIEAIHHGDVHLNMDELVGDLEHFFFVHLFGRIIPSDFHIFQRGSG